MLSECVPCHPSISLCSMKSQFCKGPCIQFSPAFLTGCAAQQRVMGTISHESLLVAPLYLKFSVFLITLCKWEAHDTLIWYLCTAMRRLLQPQLPPQSCHIIIISFCGIGIIKTQALGKFADCNTILLPIFTILCVIALLSLFFQRKMLLLKNLIQYTFLSIINSMPFLPRGPQTCPL